MRLGAAEAAALFFATQCAPAPVKPTGVELTAMPSASTVPDNNTNINQDTVEPVNSPSPDVKNTPKPTDMIPCNVSAIEADLFSKGLTSDVRTVPVLSQNGFNEVGFNDLDRMEIFTDVVRRVGQISENEKSGISEIVIPQYLTPSEVLRTVNSNFNPRYSPKLVSYESGIDMGSEGTLLIAPHANNKGKVVEEWKSPVVARDSDGSAYINGILVKRLKYQSENGSEVNALFEVPAQRVGANRADVVIVNGCSPMEVRVTGSEITGILDNSLNFAKEPQKVGLVWKTNPESQNVAEQWTVVDGKLWKRTKNGWEQSSLPEGVNKIDYIEKHINADNAEGLYGIERENETDRFAVVKYDGKEWKKFERPVRTALNNTVIPNELIPVIGKEVQQSSIERLTFADGSRLPYGYLFETPLGQDTNIVYISGYPVGGFFSYKQSEWGINYPIIEIPQCFGTQRIILAIQANKLNPNYDRLWKLGGSNIEKYKPFKNFIGNEVRAEEFNEWRRYTPRESITYKSLGEYLISQDAKYRQIVIGFQQNDSHSNEQNIITWEKGDKEVFKALKLGESWSGEVEICYYINNLIFP